MQVVFISSYDISLYGSFQASTAPITRITVWVIVCSKCISLLDPAASASLTI